MAMAASVAGTGCQSAVLGRKQLSRAGHHHALLPGLGKALGQPVLLCKGDPDDGSSVVERLLIETGDPFVAGCGVFKFLLRQYVSSMRVKPSGARSSTSCITCSGPLPRLASTMRAVAGAVRPHKPASAASASRHARRISRASTRASRIACEAPFEPIGYIGCAASPSSVTRPKVQRSTRIAIDHRVFEAALGRADQAGHVQPVEPPVGERGRNSSELAWPVPVLPPPRVIGRKLRSAIQLITASALIARARSDSRRISGTRGRP